MRLLNISTLCIWDMLFLYGDILFKNMFQLLPIALPLELEALQFELVVQTLEGISPIGYKWVFV
jgi:hypothetical protein